MRFLLVAPLVLLVGCLAGCDGMIPEKISEQPQPYEVVSSSLGKRFNVDVKNLKTGEVIRQVYVNNTCPTTRRAKKGTKVTLTEGTYKGRGGRIFRKVETTNPLCRGGAFGIRVN